MSLITSISHPPVTSNSSSSFDPTNNASILSLVSQAIQSARNLCLFEAMENQHEKDQTFRVEYYNKTQLVYSACVKPVPFQCKNGTTIQLNKATPKWTASSTDREDLINKERVRFFDLIQNICDLYNVMKTKINAVTASSSSASSDQYTIWVSSQTPTFDHNIWNVIFNSYPLCMEQYHPCLQLWENVALSTALASFLTLSNYYVSQPSWAVDENADISQRDLHRKHVEWMDLSAKFHEKYQSIRNAFADYQPKQNFENDLAQIENTWKNFEASALVIGKKVQKDFIEWDDNHHAQFEDLKRHADDLGRPSTECKKLSLEHSLPSKSSATSRANE